MWDADPTGEYNGAPYYPPKMFFSLIDFDGRLDRVVCANSRDNAVELDWESIQCSESHIFACGNGHIDVFRWADGAHVSRLYGSCQKAPTTSMDMQLLDHNRLLVLAMSSLSIWHFDVPRTHVTVAMLTPPAVSTTPGNLRLEFLAMDPAEIFSFTSKAANIAMRQMAATVVYSPVEEWRVVAFYSGDHRCWTVERTMGVRLPAIYALSGDRVYLPSTAAVLDQDSMGSSSLRTPYRMNVRRSNKEPDTWRKLFPGGIAALKNEPIVPIYHMARLGLDSIFGPIVFAKEIFDKSRDKWEFTSISKEDLEQLLSDVSLHSPNYSKLDTEAIAQFRSELNW